MILMDNILREEVKSLREKSIEVETPVKEEDIKILKEMLQYIYNSVDEEIGPKFNLRPSVGLAAPQIGINKKMIAISCFDEVGRQHDFALINPKILSYSDELTYLKTGEGCLSVDREVEGLVHRRKKIKFKALSLENDKLVERVFVLKGYLAIVFQHEYDHLQGILFVDRINKENPFFVPENSTPVKFKGEEEND